ncbi:MAG TPA: OmpA family protein [Puia sp.]|jgi:outer membrane protein OmpA-like peptidoglycan-associated protein
MKKVMICLIGCFLFALTTLRAQDSAKADPAASSAASVDTTKQTPGGSVISRDTVASAPRDTATQVRDTAMQTTDSVISLADDPAPKQDTTIYASSKKDNPEAAKDVAAVPAGASPAGAAGVGSAASQPAAPKDTATKEDKAEENTRKLDTRWFISPLLKFQFQDFAMLEKNRKGYLSDANTLPFFQRGNASFAASAYKNLTQRFSVSADLGLSFGHVTSDNVLISQTKSKTYNLLNAAVYYHLLAPSYRLQPYVTVGINDIINDASYASVPMGIGAKFNARKVMVTGQVMYGYALSKSISNTTMYSVGIYLPIKNKKQKQLDQEDNSPYNRKNDKKDTANKNNGSVVNNIFITINMDSVLKAKGLLDDNGNPVGGRRGNGGDDGDDDGSGGNGRGSRSKRARPFRSMGLDDFSDDDYKIDSLDGKPVLRFVVYFEFNEYGLTTKAFNNIDKVIGHLRNTSEFNVEIKGYTDSIGTNSYNNMLSRRRAKMVLDYMNSRGVPTELMKAKAYGSDDPVGDNKDPNQAWLNRRAEIIIHQKEFTAAAEK